MHIEGKQFKTAFNRNTQSSGGLMASVSGAIGVKWNSLGGVGSLLGDPLTDELKTPDGIGRYNNFKGGMIYWTPQTGAHEVHGAILAKWGSLGYEKSMLGYPTSDELTTPDGIGRYSTFQKGMIYWTPQTGAHEVHGAILAKWGSIGYERSMLGYPTSDELTTPDGIGRYSTFQRGMIYWTPGTGAHEVYGDILNKWSSLGYERSWLGYPKSGEMDFDGGRVSVFQNGNIYWWPDTGAIELKGVIVHYTGLVCFGETNWDGGSDADEPYVVMGVNAAGNIKSFLSRTYDDVDGGESRPDLLEIYRGHPSGVILSIALMEHDWGDRNKFRGLVEDGVKEGSKGIVALIKMIPKVGPILATITGAALTQYSGEITEFLNNALGTGDDNLGEDSIVITPKQMVLLSARTANRIERGVGYKVSSKLLSRFGASYKVYFGLVPVP
jgi:hypothetical protein